MRLRTKTFLVMLVLCGGIAALALAIQQRTVLSSFRAYLQAAQHMQAEQLATELAQSYAETGGDWEAVLRLAWRWPEMYPPLRSSPHADKRLPPHRRDPRHPGPRPHRRDPVLPPPKAMDRATTGVGHSQVRQFAIYDAQSQPLSIGVDATDRDPNWLEITAEGQTIGWLIWANPQLEEHPLDTRFEAQQRRNMLFIGATALLLAVFFAWLFSGLLLGRIRRLSAVVSAVAEGQYGTAVRDESADELGLLAADFNTMSQRLKQARVREQQWLADIAHELRTPLAVLRGELEALQDGVRRATPAAITSLQDEVTHLNRLIDDLHLLSSSESGQLTLNRQSTDLVSLIRKTCRGHAAALKTRQLELEYDLPEELTLVIDEHRIRQVLDNLLANLCRYANPGPVQVQARTAGSQVRLHIADSGPGLSETEYQQMFNRLYRADAARTRAKGGSGLGLAICRGIIEAHGGRISAAPSAAGGVQINMSLPCQESD